MFDLHFCPPSGFNPRLTSPARRRVAGCLIVVAKIVWVNSRNPESAPLAAPIYLNIRAGAILFRSISDFNRVGNRIAEPRLAESAQPQRATVALAAGPVFAFVTRPAQFERRAEFGAELHDLAFAKPDDRRDYLDLRLGLRAEVNRALERFVVFGAAIGVPGTVFRHRANVDSVGADDLGPARGDREQVGVAERDV